MTLRGRYKVAMISKLDIDGITDAEVEGEPAKLSNPLWRVSRLVAVWKISLKIVFFDCDKNRFSTSNEFWNNACLNNINLRALTEGAAHSPSLFLLEVNIRRICLVILSIINNRNVDTQMMNLPRNMKEGNMVNNLLCYNRCNFVFVFLQKVFYVLRIILKA